MQGRGRECQARGQAWGQSCCARTEYFGDDGAPTLPRPQPDTHMAAATPEWDSKSPPADVREKSQRKRDLLGMLLSCTPKSALTCGYAASTHPVCSSAQTREMTSPGGDGLMFDGYNLGGGACSLGTHLQDGKSLCD